MIPVWLGLILAPLLFLMNMQVNFTLVPWVCGSRQQWIIHLAHAVTLSLILLCAVPAYRVWSAAGREVRAEGPDAGSRNRFLSVLSLTMSGYIATVLLAHWIPNFLLEACQ
jgi:hypothetical protein